MMVLLHGVGGNASFWRETQTHLAALGWASEALDLPGYGANDTQLEHYTFESLSAWLGEQCLRLAGASPWVLVGQSFGGMIALDAVARGAVCPQGLVLMNTSPAFGRPDGQWQQDFVESRLRPLREGKSMHEVALHVAPPMIGSTAVPTALDQAVAMMGQVSAQTYERAVRCLVGFDRRADLAALNVPVLCVAGEQDLTAPARVMQTMSEKIPGSQFESLIGGGHLLSIEQPLATARCLGRFAQHLKQLGKL
jgi:3-oxoadipate enol-lactonase